MPVVDDAIWSKKAGVVVPMPSLPLKKDVDVVVEIKDPTVSCDEVAINCPDPLVVTMELIGRAERDERGTLDTVSALDEMDNPDPVMSESQSPLTFNDPVEKLPVVVALPTMVEEAVARNPWVMSRVVDVAA